MSKNQENSAQVASEESKARKQHVEEMLKESESTSSIESKVPTTFEQLAEFIDENSSEEFAFNNGHVVKITYKPIPENQGGGYETIFTPFCSAMAVTALTYSDDKKEGGIAITWLDRGDKIRTQAYPQQILNQPKALIDSLMRQRAIYISPEPRLQRIWQEYLLTQLPKNHILYTQKVGWAKNHSFVLGDSCIIGDTDIIYQPVSPAHEQFNIVGNNKTWNEKIGKFCVNNPSMVISALVPLSSVILPFLGMNGSIYHLVGSSSSGKTISTGVASSIFGKGIDSWKETDNRMENRLEAANHTGIVLDEIHEAEPRHVQSIGYMVGNGKGKGRMNPDGTSQRDREWVTNALSTGELTIEQKLLDRGMQVSGGLSVRIIEGVANIYEYRCFRDIHGFNDGADFSGYLEKVTAIKGGGAEPAASGCIGLSFVKEIRKDLIEKGSEFIQILLDELKVIADEITPEGADSQIRRMCESCAALALAGEIAIQYGIIEWEEGHAKTMMKIFIDDMVIPTRGSISSKEEQNAIDQVTDFMDSHHMSKFCSTANGAVFHGNQLYGWFDESSGERTYYLTNAAWKEMIKGLNKNATIKALTDEGMLIPDKDKTAKQKKINGKNKRLYWIRY